MVGQWAGLLSPRTSRLAATGARLATRSAEPMNIDAGPPAAEVRTPIPIRVRTLLCPDPTAALGERVRPGGIRDPARGGRSERGQV